MALLWILLGVALALAFIMGYYWIKFGASKLMLITGVTGIIVFLSAVAWSISSMLKGELMAATLGVITLGIPAIILIASGWKIIEA